MVEILFVKFWMGFWTSFVLSYTFTLRSCSKFRDYRKCAVLPYSHISYAPLFASWGHSFLLQKKCFNNYYCTGCRSIPT